MIVWKTYSDGSRPCAVKSSATFFSRSPSTKSLTAGLGKPAGMSSVPTKETRCVTTIPCVEDKLPSYLVPTVAILRPNFFIFWRGCEMARFC
ncbi:hypothetical protein CPB83DRAFT_864198 [Crepidotus variabilis]|uniref:Uncharacterized protein n=1 Tax=Crepidotus variabilis TaxID=179855 RepID=A0A9P6JIV1_9AGAR|nr:hypothetical protein CPB83DRAFT_864198 [Crepidotus variabilis]